MKTWRLIEDSQHGAAENMAIDEAIMLSCTDGSAPPTVRIYSWSRPSISLGCLQPILRQAQDVRGGFDVDFCRGQGIELVRRITGGRAVIHGSDVTFSIALRESDLPEGCSSVLECHQWMMGGIVAALRLLGIDSAIGGGPLRTPHSAISNAAADCFAHIAECDVRVGQKKAVGSAQVRRSGAVLEQGSIPYAAPGFDTTRVFGRATKSVSAEDIPLAGVASSAIEQALIGGFSELLLGNLTQDALSSDEKKLAAELARDKYSTPEWTLRQN